MSSDSPREGDLAADLARALAANEFYLVYQPEIDLHTNGFAGVEALLRWRHPQRGVMNAAQFLPLLDESGAIVAVGAWIVRTACLQGAEWHTKGYRFPVSVNASLTQLRQRGFADDVARCLHESRLAPSRLTIEFSHAARGEPEVLSHLAELRALGVQLAIDDFSPGHPAFDELRDLSVDIIKLDRDFVAASAGEVGHAQIHQLVQEARSLHLRVIASGVEDAMQRDHLRLEHVDVGQGYHFARPFEAHEIDLFLEDFALFSGRPL